MIRTTAQTIPSIVFRSFGFVFCAWLAFGIDAPPAFGEAEPSVGAGREALSSVPGTEDQNADPADEPDANLEPVEAEAASDEPSVASENTIVPHVEDLLHNNPTRSPSTARFSDTLDPPAEVGLVWKEASQDAEIPEYNVPIVMDSSVQSHMRYFNTSIRNRFEQWLVRLSRYRPLVDTIFAEFHLPSDLVYLSLVESGFNPYAYSRAKATGPWQFMKGTAKVYGLRVDSYVDERRDPIKSTIAAARYLRDLYDMFGTWPLAMAAYNAGEGKVMRALHKAQAESFTDISKTRLIRRETKEYVPRFMAATIIAKNPDRYGFPQEPTEIHEFDEVVVNRPMHFHAIANATGIRFDVLRLLNPELRRDATPPGGESYHLKVPVGTKARVEQLLARIPSHKFPAIASKPSAPVAATSRWYKVRVGDTLEKLSKRFRIPLKTLMSKNSLTGNVIRPGELLVISR
ncbi:putative Lytic murein transglycosylase [Nitrospira sp. KM1]|uniref:lytic transglycosylase domain-containing protein n=1 Tax=Nitrospira sp. KM1 TaxID=1936990 RepID=UPI0013A7370A|nr:lytic transglycosylase domain-containing protein [Nitrospira sp. KM1]BCA54489.1 putative Lytic murein transglycosylase [Nitrospira sp. KM1]